MAKYYVVEEITYIVEANSNEEAIQHVIDDENRDSHCFDSVSERDAFLMDGETDPEAEDGD